MGLSNEIKSEKLIYCTFCNKSQNEVFMLIAGPNVYICDECVNTCSEAIDKKKRSIGDHKQ